MGVQDLWKLLQPCGNRLAIDTLSTKRLAVDVSIWLTQFIKAMRDGEGKMLDNAHLLGMFRRICRLLFHRIRPVFVFDGPAPALKRRTLSQRRLQRRKQRSTVQRAAERILLQQLQLKNIETLRRELDRATRDDEDNPSAAEAASLLSPTLPSRKRRKSSQNRHVAPSSALASGSLPVDAVQPIDIASSDEEKVADADADVFTDEAESDAAGSVAAADDQDGSDTEQLLRTNKLLDAETIARLPRSIQYDVLSHQRRLERERHADAFEKATADHDPGHFSSLQLTKFLKQTALNKEIEQVPCWLR